MSHIRQDNAMAEEAVRQDVLNTAESLGDQSDLGVRPRFSAPRFIGIRFLPSQQYPNYLLFYRELSDRAIRVCHFYPGHQACAHAARLPTASCG